MEAGEAPPPPIGPRHTDLSIRILSAVVMLAIAAFAFWRGGRVLDGFIVVVAAAAYYEFIRLIGRIPMSMAMTIAAALIGLIYIGYAALVLIVLPALYVAVLIGVVVFTDTFAFFFGRTIGGPKIAPRISPSKTWAGLVGGMLGAALWVGLALGTTRYMLSGLGGSQPSLGEAFVAPDLAFAAVVGGGLAVAALEPALEEVSSLRRAKVKDSSNLIPGHGGVFDRVDGILPVAIIAGIVTAWTGV
jgi:phosphatidate cytidylyltransferase